MKKILLINFITFISIVCSGQNSSIPFRQFYFNPYTFNPSYAGLNGYTELYLSYRKQWSNVNDAPIISGINFQYATRSRVSLGMNITDQEVVALHNTSLMATFVYSLPITTTQSIRFGISGGVGTNKLRLDEGEYDPNDPAIINALANNVYMDGNFGFVYVNKRLRIGFALPKLFGQKYISPQNLGDNQFSQLKNQLYSISYKFDIVPGSISLEPYFLYRMNRDQQNSWEASGVVYFKEKIWVGSSFNQTNGAAFFLGMNVKEKFRFGYSYELPPTNTNFRSTNSHELHLNIRIGKKKEPNTKKSKTEEVKIKEQPQVKPEEQHTEPIVVAEQIAPTAKDTSIITSNVPPKQEEKLVLEKTADPEHVAAEPAKKANTAPPVSFSLAKGHYVIVGAFRIMNNASQYLRELAIKGTIGNVAINPKNNMYYVYIFSSYDIEETRKARNQYRLKRFFSEAWVLSIE